MPWVGTELGYGAPRTQHVCVVNLPEQVKLLLEGEQVGPPFCADVHVNLKRNVHGELQLLEVAFFQICPAQRATHLRSGLDDLAARLHDDVADHPGILQHHVLAELLAQVAPRLFLPAGGPDLVPHDQVVGDREGLPPPGARAHCDGQRPRGEELLARSSVLLGQALQRLLAVDDWHEEALPKSPLAIELLRQRRLLRDLPHAHDKKPI
mmetsp:Transcript_66564/g.187466  ORF Transcript_66564/g.187466 Transcript_66564/m.187466 type:complete len:209 (+) Transcript_66564:1700-2326(+)